MPFRSRAPEQNGGPNLRRAGHSIGGGHYPISLVNPLPCWIDTQLNGDTYRPCYTCQINAFRARVEMSERVPQDNELFPTEVDARVAAVRFNARNGNGRRAAAVSQHARGWVVVICQYAPVGYLSWAESE